MPRKCELTYVAASDRHGPRWRKFYKRRLYQWPAGRGKTDKAAYDAALAAWQAKKREVDGLPEPEPPRPVEDIVADLAASYAEAAWPEALAQLQANTVTVQDRVDAFLKTREARVQSGQLSHARLESLRSHLGFFSGWIGGKYPVEAIDGPTLIRYKIHVDAACKHRTAGHRIEAVKTWMRWLHNTEAIKTLPRAFSSGELKVTKSVPTIQTFTVEQIKTLIAMASKRTRLYILLALNCGMYQGDISDIMKSEIDLVQGSITRKRSKTRREKNSPTVTYTLWPQTRDVLQEELAKEGPCALLGRGSLPLLRWVDGHKNDAVRCAWNRLVKKTGIAGTFKLLRKTSASLLADSEWPDVVNLYLGHAAASMADLHYAKAAQGRLAAALEWLRGQFGV